MAKQYYVEGDRKKRKSPLRSLWAIPVMILIDIAGFVLAIIGDSQLMPAEPREGHPFPVITFTALMVLAVITAIVVVLAIVIAIVRALKASNNTKEN
ncbi:MAG: hypothetical protein IJT40_02950 [Firmicutes bacterium]|nr:hypothetical protein [Bacillota bacterium]